MYYTWFTSFTPIAGGKQGYKQQKANNSKYYTYSTPFPTVEIMCRNIEKQSCYIEKTWIMSEKLSIWNLENLQAIKRIFFIIKYT